jgi:glycosyltransferase involved in cell wall biosynthesis
MYNAEKSIMTCVDSVIGQSFFGEIEIIIINDGSTDNSRQIVETIIELNPEKNIKLINKSNGGVSTARNVGLESAKGEYIALLDSDDIWLSNKLEVQMEILSNNNSIDFLGCARNNETLNILGRKITSLHRAKPLELLIKMYPQTSTAIFKRELYEKFGGYNEQMTHSEDGFLWLTYCQKANFYYSPDSLVITGGGKPNFGHSGLSANLKAMHNGSLQILSMALNQNIISFMQYILLLCFYELKYLRRKLVSRKKN